MFLGAYHRKPSYLIRALHKNLNMIFSISLIISAAVSIIEETVVLG